MKERAIRTTIYLSVIAGTALTVAALRESTVLYGRPECVAHFVLYAILLVLALETDLRHGGEAGGLSMMVLLGALAVMLSYYGCGLFTAGNLAHAPVAVMFLIVCAGALLLGRTELMRGCLLAAFLVCLYSTTESPAEKYLETYRSRVLFVSEILLIAAAYVYTYKVRRFTTEGWPLRRRVLSFLYQEEHETSPAMLKTRCTVQIAFVASAMIALLCAKFLYDTEVPLYYLTFFCITVAAAVWQAGYCSFRYESHLIVISMLAKAITDLCWSLGPAEHDYSGIYVLTDIVLFALAAGGCRKLFGIIAAAETAMIAIAVCEYFCDPVVFLFPKGQLLMISRVLLIAGTAMYAIGPWSDQIHMSGPGALGEKVLSEKEVTGNEVQRSIDAGNRQC